MQDRVEIPLTTNEVYWDAARRWLRLKLAELASSYTSSARMSPRRGCLRFFSRASEPTRPVPSIGEIDRAKADLRAAETADPPPLMMRLVDLFMLTPFERDLLMFCVSMELDPQISVLCARAHDDPMRRYPTFALAMRILDRPDWSALTPTGSLRYWRLIEITQGAGQPLSASGLRADERIVNWLMGIHALDDRLSLLVTPVPSTPDTLPASQQTVAEQIIYTLENSPQLPLVQLVGGDVSSKRLTAAYVANTFGEQLFSVSTSLLPAQPGELELFNRLWERESCLMKIALLIEAGAFSREGHTAALEYSLTRTPGLVFLDTPEAWRTIGRESMIVEVSKPTALEQRAVWSDALGITGDLPAALAAQFDLDTGTINMIASRALIAASDNSTLQAVAWKTCVETTRPKMSNLAVRLTPKSEWDDLILPKPETDQLWLIRQQIEGRARVYDDWRYREKLTRGLGISVLFAGPSGTGKTMAAEVLSGALKLEAFRIDLAGVVSKYIGETEKNLKAIFDEAQGSGAILFFDEADALFGKRSEVKDSHDRYANIEINYLLQRIEAYSGLAILATNMKSALDQAFLRRLRFIVNFPFPDKQERRRIWKRIFPSGVPNALGDEDYNWLAGLSLTGGSIHNIALAAAFLAAAQPDVGKRIVTLAMVLEAARAEFRKLEQPILESDFTPPARQHSAAGSKI
jgi:hypothetical protein